MISKLPGTFNQGQSRTKTPSSQPFLIKNFIYSSAFSFPAQKTHYSAESSSSTAHYQATTWIYRKSLHQLLFGLAGQQLALDTNFKFLSLRFILQVFCCLKSQSCYRSMLMFTWTSKSWWFFIAEAGNQAKWEVSNIFSHHSHLLSHSNAGIKAWVGRGKQNPEMIILDLIL